MTRENELESYLKNIQGEDTSNAAEISITVLKTNLLVLAGFISLTAAIFGEETELLQEIITNGFTIVGLLLSVTATGSSGIIYGLTHLSKIGKRRREIDNILNSEGDYFSDLDESEMKKEHTHDELASLATIAIIFTAVSVPLIATGVITTFVVLELTEVLMFLLVSIFGVLIVYVLGESVMEFLSNGYERSRVSLSELKKVLSKDVKPTKGGIKIALKQSSAIFLMLLSFLLTLYTIIQVMWVLSSESLMSVSLGTIFSAILFIILFAIIVPPVNFVLSIIFAKIIGNGDD